MVGVSIPMGHVAPSLADCPGGVKNHTECLDNPRRRAQNLATLPAPGGTYHGIIGEREACRTDDLPEVNAYGAVCKWLTAES